MSTLTVVPDDHLHRHLIEGDTERYVIGYRAVTLIAASLSSSVNPYPGTVSYLLNEGSKCPPNIKIHAEDVYIPAGSTFTFPGKNVVLTANRVFNVPGLLNQTTITFDCRGREAEAMPLDTSKNGKKGDDGTADTEFDLLKLSYFWTGSATVPGTSGAPGANSDKEAEDGGCFTCLARLKSLLPSGNATLKALCAGGKGGRGQRGGDGGAGGNGSRTNHNRPEPPSEYMKGGDGGDGGKGGQGGIGGSGGLIWNLGSAFARLEAEDKVQNSMSLELPTSTTISKGASTLSFDESSDVVAGGPPGQGGDKGLGGSSGIPGHHGRYAIIGGIGTQSSWHAPVDGPAGKKGTDGSEGDSGPTTSTAGFRFPKDAKDPAKNSSDLVASLAINPLQLAMILKRLLFEYQLMFSLQAMDPRGEDEALKAKRALFKTSSDWLGSMIGLMKLASDATNEVFSSTLGVTAEQAKAWLRSVMQASWSSQADTRLQLLLTYQQFVNLSSATVPLDMYGQKSTQIKPNVALSDLTAAINTLAFVEQEQAKIFEILATTAKANEEVAKTTGILQDMLKKYDDDHETLVKKLEEQYVRVQEARKSADEARFSTKSAIDEFWHTLSAEFSCKDFAEVLAAVGNVLMFAHAESGAIFQVGGLASVGSSLAGIFATVPTAEGAVEKDALNGKFYMLEANLKDAALQGEIAAKSKDILSLSGPDKDYVSAIITERSSFQSLCNRYFSDDKLSAHQQEKMKKAKDKFDEYVDYCQEYHREVIQYNTLAVEFAKLEADHVRNKQIDDQIKGQHFNANLPWLDLMQAFYTDVITFQKAKCLKFLFDAVKACNGIFLKRVSVLDPLWNLGSFDRFDSSQLKSACMTRLADDVDHYTDTWSHNKPTDVDNRISSLRPDKWPSVFRNLKASRRFVLLMTPESAIADHGFNDQWFDVRMIGLRIYFVRATNTKATELAGTQTIDVKIHLGGVFSVLDAEYREFVFEIPENTESFIYDYSRGPGGGKYKEASRTPLATRLLSNFHFQIKLEGRDKDSLTFSTPMDSPFRKYTFSVPDSVQVENVTEIILGWDLRFRTSEKKRGNKFAK